jgi:hypothetical protein
VRRLVIGVAAGAVMFIAAAPASAHVFTIKGDWKMGSFLVKRDGTLRGAIDAFGAPGDRDRRYGGSACIVRWPSHGLKMAFYNLGGQDACRGRARVLLERTRSRAPLAHGSRPRDR